MEGVKFHSRRHSLSLWLCAQLGQILSCISERCLIPSTVRPSPALFPSVVDIECGRLATMSRPAYSEVVEPTTPLTPTSTSRHRPGFSVTTTISGIADSTISSGTVDALHSQLAHFPPPPSEVPTPTTPSFPGFLFPTAPLKLPQRNPHPDVPHESPQQSPSTLHTPGESASRNATPRQVRRQPSLTTHATNGTVGSLSPFDWHEGSSSIDIDPADDRMLPASFITSLISSSEHTSPRSNPFSMSLSPNSAQLFSGGKNPDMMSSISDATYPPHNYPPISSPNKAIPPGAAYLESSGRSTKANSVATRTSDDHGGLSVGSHTPFINPAYRYGPIQEDTMGELRARGEAPRHSSSTNHHKRSSRGRRQSVASTRTTKSYVSSLISKLSRATSRKQHTTKPLPPVPSIPSDLSNSGSQKFDESMPLPQLANRAEILSRMLARGHRPDSGYFPSNPTPISGMEMHGNGVSQLSTPNWPISPKESPYGHRSEKVETSNPSVGFWDRVITRFGRRRIIVALIAIAILLIVLAVLLGVLLRNKSVLPDCPTGETGTECDIGTSRPRCNFYGIPVVFPSLI